MKYIFHPEAEDEFQGAIDYYEEREKGLGLDFSIEIYSSIRNIINHPMAWTILEDGIRRCQTKRFPYGIIYNAADGKIFILAIMNLRRDPDYWKHRIK